MKEYEAFNVHPYNATLEVMKACSGWVDRDEYDLFLSRIRTPRETQWAIDGIQQFRELRIDERETVLEEVRHRVPTEKIYQNWRDMGLHTFSLFHLGTSAMRADQRLLLSSTLVRPQPEEGGGGREGARARAVLRIPAPEATAELIVPPTSPVVNPGSDAELLVGKLLKAAGWEVAYYTNRRGFGFDLWARRGRAAMVIEVKSSYAELGALTLTELEYQAARHHGRNYVLVTVEHANSDNPVVRIIEDPAQSLRLEERTTREYHSGRNSWTRAAAPMDLYRD
jgi:hypothetical protein